MEITDIQALRDTSVASSPFDHIIVPGFLKNDRMAGINADFPEIKRPGSVPLPSLSYGPVFQTLIREIQSPKMTAAMSEKFEIDLAERPTMVTVRGQCRLKDGQVHTDSKGKLVTVLIYLNNSWESEGGRLRLLRSNANLDDYAVEVPPDEGTLLAFKCTEDAWHGHKPYQGQRRAIQLNWVRDEDYANREQKRHRFSAFFKNLRF